MLTIVGILLILHVILGGLAYWRFAVVKSKNKVLTGENQALSLSNASIVQLFDQLEKLEADNNKFKTMLGIGEETIAHGGPQFTQIPNYYLGDSGPQAAMGGPENEISNAELQKTLQYLARAGSDLQNYTRNIPTFLPIKGYLSKPYIDSTGKEAHNGIDITGNVGTPICAAADGVVIFSGWKPDLGNTIIVSHGNGFFTRYGHNKLNTIAEGDFVEKGQIIALLGSSGESSGPHLHFEIWKDMKRVDPRNYIIGLN